MQTLTNCNPHRFVVAPTLNQRFSMHFVFEYANGAINLQYSARLKDKTALFYLISSQNCH